MSPFGKKRSVSDGCALARGGEGHTVDEPWELRSERSTLSACDLYLPEGSGRSRARWRRPVRGPSGGEGSAGRRGYGCGTLCRCAAFKEGGRRPAALCLSTRRSTRVGLWLEANPQDGRVIFRRRAAALRAGHGDCAGDVSATRGGRRAAHGRRTGIPERRRRRPYDRSECATSAGGDRRALRAWR